MSKQLIAGYYRTFINGIEYTININNNKFRPAYWMENPYDTMANYIRSTWAEVKALKDTSKLEPGTFYLITDYVTTTVQPETKVCDDYHYFDILVFALDKNQLSEQAWAAHSERDVEGYFNNCKLEAWELKYCIENDTRHYGFADSVNGKGVIYYMKDENNNVMPYDFKNIMFKRYAITNIEYTGITQEKQEYYNSTFIYGNNGGKCFAFRDEWGGEMFPYNFSITTGAYDNINAKVIWTFDENIYEWYYTYTTFRDDDPGNGVEDQSIFGMNTYYTYGCGENEIKPWYWEESKDYDDKYEGNEQFLNNIVFFGYYYINDDGRELCHTFANKFGVKCRYNQFGNFVYCNQFGNFVYCNQFGNNVHHNQFGNNVNQNQFGNDVYYNQFGNDVYWNQFGYDVVCNQFGNDVYWNQFGNGVGFNRFGNRIHRNQFGNYVVYNQFENNVNQNQFGNMVYHNQFGNFVHHNQFGNYVYNWIVENNIFRLSFTDNYSTGNANYLRNIHVLSGYNYNYNYNSGTAVPSGLQYNTNYVQLIGFSDNNNTVTIKNALQ